VQFGREACSQFQASRHVKGHGSGETIANKYIGHTAKLAGLQRIVPRGGRAGEQRMCAGGHPPCHRSHGRMRPSGPRFRDSRGVNTKPTSFLTVARRGALEKESLWDPPPLQASREALGRRARESPAPASRSSTTGHPQVAQIRAHGAPFGEGLVKPYGVEPCL